MNTTKSVVLLYPSTEYDIEQISNNITDIAKRDDFTIIEIIRAKSIYDSYAMRQLIETIRQQQEPVTLIIDSSCYLSRIHMLSWSVFGTLLVAGLIREVQVYYGHSMTTAESKQAKLGILEKTELDFLGTTAFHFEVIASLVRKAFDE